MSILPVNRIIGTLPTNHSSGRPALRLAAHGTPPGAAGPGSGGGDTPRRPGLEKLARHYLDSLTAYAFAESGQPDARTAKRWELDRYDESVLDPATERLCEDEETFLSALRVIGAKAFRLNGLILIDGATIGNGSEWGIQILRDEDVVS